MNPRIKELSDYISFHAMSEARIYPIDRFFLEPFVDGILTFDDLDFVKYNFETSNLNYPIRLMLCLPELWSRFDFDKMVALYRNFESEFAYFNFVIFSSAYLEVDFVQIIFEDDKIDVSIKDSLRVFLLSQFPNLNRDEQDIFWNYPNEVGIDLKDWDQIRMNLLTDPRSLPAIKDLNELESRIARL